MKQTYKELLTFLKGAVDAGWLPYNTARTRRTAVRRVFSVQPEYEDADIFKVDVNEMIEKFVERTKSTGETFTQGTIDTYRSRIKKSIEEFALRLQDMPQIAKNKEKQFIETFEMPLKLRDELTIHMKGIPINLSHEEAERICVYIKSLATILNGSDKSDSRGDT